MMRQLKDLFQLTDRFYVPTEDILLIDINISGVNMDVDTDRVRMYVRLLFGQDFPFFCAIPIRKNTKYRIKNGFLYYDRQVMARVENIEGEKSDLYDVKENGAVLTLPDYLFRVEHMDPTSNIVDIGILQWIHKNFDAWMDHYEQIDLSSLQKIIIKQKNWPNENSLVQYILQVYARAQKLNFCGELMYLGNQLRSEEAMKKLENIENFSYCFQLDYFHGKSTNLEIGKKRLSLSQSKEIMAMALQQDWTVNYTYLVGIDDLENLKMGIRSLLTVTNRFPIINIWQGNDPTVKGKEVPNLEFFLEARTAIEAIYEKSRLKPQILDSNQPLWYTRFGDDILW